VCLGSACGTCTSDAQCGAGNKCCRGACYLGIECCGDADCDTTPALRKKGNLCRNNQCTGCSSDAECGALSCCDADGPGGLPGQCEAFCRVSRCFLDGATYDEGTYAGTTAAGSALNPQCSAGRLCTTTAQPGTWTVTVDSQVAGAGWQQVDLSTLKSAGTQVLVRAKTAASAAALVNTAWWNGLMEAGRALPETGGSISLSAAAGPVCLQPGRFLQLEVTLVPAAGVSPVVTSVCARFGPSSRCTPRAVCDANATPTANGTSCVCNPGYRGDGLTCVSLCPDPATHFEAGACVPNTRACALPNATGTQTWSAGAWGPCRVTSCTAGFGNCDGSDPNGCEVSLTTSDANCGACQVACGAGQSCYGGRCAATCPRRYIYDSPVPGCANLSLSSRSFAASSSYPGYPASNAGDTNLCTGWNAGGYAPATWYVDLGSVKSVAALSMVPDMTPPGLVEHVIRGSADGSNWFQVLSIAQGMARGGLYTFTLPSRVNVRWLSVSTRSSPSWVAWLDVNIWGDCP
jgi:hypothetical protein